MCWVVQKGRIRLFKIKALRTNAFVLRIGFPVTVDLFIHCVFCFKVQVL